VRTTRRVEPACYGRSVERDPEIQAILARGRATRKPTPRWVWTAAAIVGAICGLGFAIMMLGDPAPADHRATPAEPVRARRPTSGSGLGIGLVIGAGVGIVIGFSIGRQRRDHSSRSSP
jgi:hypothetical protein